MDRHDRQLRLIQWVIALPFFVLGGWALLAPQSVIDLTLRPEYRIDNRILPFTIACFGAQALISGLFAACSRFTRATFLAYGVALLPFFLFNYWFTVVDPVFTRLGLLDLVGNLLMFVACIVGWRKAGSRGAAANN